MTASIKTLHIIFYFFKIRHFLIFFNFCGGKKKYIYKHTKGGVQCTAIAICRISVWCGFPPKCQYFNT